MLFMNVGCVDANWIEIVVPGPPQSATVPEARWGVAGAFVLQSTIQRSLEAPGLDLQSTIKTSPGAPGAREMIVYRDEPGLSPNYPPLPADPFFA